MPPRHLSCKPQRLPKLAAGGATFAAVDEQERTSGRRPHPGLLIAGFLVLVGLGLLGIPVETGILLLFAAGAVGGVLYVIGVIAAGHRKAAARRRRRRRAERSGRREGPTYA